MGDWLKTVGYFLSSVAERHRQREALGVYCYHGVLARRRDSRLERNLHLAADFRRQARWLRRFRVVSLTALASELAMKESERRPLVAITFDDGYANNLLAAEILSTLKLPWTLFVSTAAVGKRLAIWTVELSLLLLHGDCRVLEVLGKAWPLGSRELREVAFQSIRYPMKAMDTTNRRKTMDAIRAQFSSGETERLLELFPDFKMLSWKQLRQLAASGVEIGSHGVDHQIHHRDQDPELRRRELVESKQEIEIQIGKPCRFFAFPNGDYCDASVEEVAAVGYELAFTTRPGFIRPGVNRLLLPRISPGNSLVRLKQQLRGLS